MGNGIKKLSINCDPQSVPVSMKEAVDTKPTNQEQPELVDEAGSDASSRWAEFRLAVVGHLIFMDVEGGQLSAKLKSLSETEWKHPITGKPVIFGYSTIEHWYYLALNNPGVRLDALASRRRDTALHWSLSKQVCHYLTQQAQRHPSWTYSQHHKELVQFMTKHEWGQPPSYSTVRRFLLSQGFSHNIAELVGL